MAVAGMPFRVLEHGEAATSCGKERLGRVRTEELLDGDADRTAAAPDANHVVRTETVVKYLPCEAVGVHKELVCVNEHFFCHASGKQRSGRDAPRPVRVGANRRVQVRMLYVGRLHNGTQDQS